MSEIITLQIDREAANIFKSTSAEVREKLQVLFGIWIKELGKGGTESLKRTMNELGDNAGARGLTPEVLKEILEED